MIEREIISFSHGLSVTARRINAIGFASNCEIVPMHLHKEFEIMIIKHGCIKCISQDGEYIAECGDVLFINANVPHSTVDILGDHHYDIIQYNFFITSDSVFRYVDRLSTLNDTACRVFKSSDKITELLTFHIESVTDEYYSRNDFWMDYVRSSLAAIMATLKRSGAISTSVQNKYLELEKIKPAIEYIEDNYAQHISTSSLASLLNFNESYFCRLFKNATNANLSDYLNFVRCAKAKHLINRGIGITDAAYMSGFSSVSYFNRVFKKYNHCAPSQYKRLRKYGDDFTES